jgi:hypothetical protein
MSSKPFIPMFEAPAIFLQSEEGGAEISAPDSITILTTKGKLATKRITWSQVTGAPQIQNYDSAKHFGITERQVADIHELAAVLETVSRSPISLIVRGKPAAGIDRNHAPRRVRPRTKADGTIEPATLEPAARRWIALDIDSIPGPDSIDLIHEPDAVIEYVVEHLPEEFHSATRYWQFTSGHGIKPGIPLNRESGCGCSSGPIGRWRTGS